MENILQVTLAVPSLGLLTSLAVPASVRESGEIGAISTDQETWGAMHEAYEHDEWEVLAQASMR